MYITDAELINNFHSLIVMLAKGIAPIAREGRTRWTRLTYKFLYTFNFSPRPAPLRVLG